MTLVAGIFACGEVDGCTTWGRGNASLWMVWPPKVQICVLPNLDSDQSPAFPVGSKPVCCLWRGKCLAMDRVISDGGDCVTTPTNIAHCSHFYSMLPILVDQTMKVIWVHGSPGNILHHLSVFYLHILSHCTSWMCSLKLSSHLWPTMVGMRKISCGYQGFLKSVRGTNSWKEQKSVWGTLFLCTKCDSVCHKCKLTSASDMSVCYAVVVIFLNRGGGCPPPGSLGCPISQIFWLVYSKTVLQRQVETSWYEWIP